MKLPSQLKKYIESEDSVIDEIIPIDPYNDHPKFHHVAAVYKKQIAESMPFKLEPNAIDSDYHKAILKACMEAIERWSIVNMPQHIVKASFKSIHQKTELIDPTDIRIPLQNQIPHHEDIRSQSFSWVKAKEILSNKNIFIPAQTFFFLPSNIKESHLRLQDTTGSAASFSQEEAIKQGIFEAVERESFAIFFYTQARHHKIRVSSISPQTRLRQLIDYISSYLFEPIIVDMTTDLGIPSFSCWLFNKTQIGPRVVVGAGAHIQAEIAIEKALLESVQSLTNCRNMLSLDTKLRTSFVSKKRPYLNRASVRNMLYWAEDQSEQQDFKEFIHSLPFKDYPSSGVVSKSSLTLKSVVDQLKNTGIHQIYWLNTSPRLEQYGIYVTKVFLPELVPLSLHTPYNYEKVKRMIEVPERLQIESIQKPELFTHIPHPFP